MKRLFDFALPTCAIFAKILTGESRSGLTATTGPHDLKSSIREAMDQHHSFLPRSKSASTLWATPATASHPAQTRHPRHPTKPGTLTRKPSVPFRPAINTTHEVAAIKVAIRGNTLLPSRPPGSMSSCSTSPFITPAAPHASRATSSSNDRLKSLKSAQRSTSAISGYRSCINSVGTAERFLASPGSQRFSVDPV